MRGIVFLGDRELELREFADPTPGPGEVVLAMKASGMCGSDLHAYRASRQGNVAASLGLGGGAGPVIAGHEPCGVVAERGPGVPEAAAPIGRRVMNHHYKGCGHCRHCRTGWSQLCRSGVVVYGVTGHGGHAHFMKVPASTLVPLPDELSFEEGAAISCGTGTAYGALRRLDLSGRDTLAVFGQGPVGLSATLLGVAMGARVIAVDIVAERRRLAREFGADAVIDPREADPAAALRELTRGEGVDAALDCTGSPEARVAAVRSARTWGRVCFVGEGNTVTLDVSPDLLRKQLTLLASWTFSTVGQEECARFVVDRRVPLRRLLTHHFALPQAAEAYKLFDTQTTGKGVFVF
ncbi:MAG TPA: zinc-binding dehydrogenase [Methylomirabilota bacterium]|jgi:threonine dehydrogenase-like Zn-dependent dehydrogenase|nr:zinc-binding dehydrogenase [Methylomirabilota bacterium]